MNSAQAGPPDDGDDGYDAVLNSSAAKLDVYRHERLAYTETPVKRSSPGRNTTRKSALLKAMYYWVCSRL